MSGNNINVLSQSSPLKTENLSAHIKNVTENSLEKFPSHFAEKLSQELDSIKTKTQEKISDKTSEKPAEKLIRRSVDLNAIPANLKSRGPISKAALEISKSPSENSEALESDESEEDKEATSKNTLLANELLPYGPLNLAQNLASDVARQANPKITAKEIKITEKEIAQSQINLAEILSPMGSQSLQSPVSQNLMQQINSNKNDLAENINFQTTSSAEKLSNQLQTMVSQSNAANPFTNAQSLKSSENLSLKSTPVPNDTLQNVLENLLNRFDEASFSFSNDENSNVKLPPAFFASEGQSLQPMTQPLFYRAENDSTPVGAEVIPLPPAINSSEKNSASPIAGMIAAKQIFQEDIQSRGVEFGDPILESRQLPFPIRMEEINSDKTIPHSSSENINILNNRFSEKDIQAITPNKESLLNPQIQVTTQVTAQKFTPQNSITEKFTLKEIGKLSDFIPVKEDIEFPDNSFLQTDVPKNVSADATPKQMNRSVDQNQEKQFSEGSHSQKNNRENDFDFKTTDLLSKNSFDSSLPFNTNSPQNVHISKNISSNVILNNVTDTTRPLAQAAFDRIQNLSQQLQVRGGGLARVEIRDAQLGVVNLSVRMGIENKLSIEINTADPLVKAELDKGIESLKKSLTDQRFSIAELNVVTDPSRLKAPDSSGAASQQNQSQNQQQNLFGQQSQNQKQNSFYGQNSQQNNNWQQNIPLTENQLNGRQKLSINDGENYANARQKNIVRGANGSLKVTA